MTIGGQNISAPAFSASACILANDERISSGSFFTFRPVAEAVNLGLVALKPGADPDRIARELRAGFAQRHANLHPPGTEFA